MGETTVLDPELDFERFVAGLELRSAYQPIGSHYSGALIARDLGDSGPDVDRRYEFVVTHDRDLVLGAARSLMSRITTA
jgi:hypothetical protein